MTIKVCHTLSPSAAIGAAERLAKKLVSMYGGSYKWVMPPALGINAALEYQHDLVAATLVLQDQEAILEIALGAKAAFFSLQIRRRVEQELKNNFSN